MNNVKQRAFFARSGLWLSLVAALFVLGWRGWVVAHKPAHLMEMVDELGWIGHFRARLYPNNSNTALIFSQTTEGGEGIYYCSANGGKKKLVCEQAEKGWSWQRFGMEGWSPDDKLFALSFPSNPAKYEEQIIVYNGDSGEAVVKLMVSPLISDFSWLSPYSFVYASRNGDSQDIQVIEKKQDGNWILAQTFKQLGNKEMTSLVATSSNSIAWRQGASVWSLDFTSGIPEKIWESATDQLVEFTYSRESQEFLLNCSDANGQYMTRFYQRNHWTADAGRITGQTDTILNAAWFNNGARYAYINWDQGGNAFHIKTNTDSPPILLPWPGLAADWSLNGDCLYIRGDLTNQPPGIWQYNLNSGDLKCIVSALDHPLKRAQIVSALTGTFTNSAGRATHYFVWQPVQLEAGKKHPLIIGQTTYNWWLPYPQIAANGGCYFVFVNRPSWWDGLENWGDDVMQAYELMAKNPNVDTNQVFLYGSSAETGPLSQLLTEKPDLWQGAILFNPTDTPDPATVHISKLLVLDGTDDGDAAKRWPDYQNRAAQEGMTVKLALVDGAIHVSHSTANEHEKTEQIARFLFGD